MKNFVDLHGGNVGMKSVEGGGTEVVVWLPVTAVTTKRTPLENAPLEANA